MAQSGHHGPEERLKSIEQRISELGRVRIEDLASDFGVSEMTIRRDLDELEALGVARRIRGGASALGPLPFASRHRHNAHAKAIIAEKLSALVPGHGSVAFDASTTIYRLATLMSGARDLVVVTNGLDTFKALSGKPGITAILSGGTQEPSSGSLVGPVATRSVEDYIFDFFFCSGAALDPTLGSSEASIGEAEVKRVLGRVSERTVLAVDHTKLGTRGRARMFHLDKLAFLVTDLSPDHPLLEPYAGKVAIR